MTLDGQYINMYTGGLTMDYGTNHPPLIVKTSKQHNKLEGDLTEDKVAAVKL